MEEKSREEILAERKLRKVAKQAKKKGLPKTQNESQSTENTEIDCARENFDKLKISVASKVEVPPSDSKKFPVSSEVREIRPANVQKSVTAKEEKSTPSTTERKTEEKNNEINSDSGKSKAQLRAERRAKQVLFLLLVHSEEVKFEKKN